MKCVNDGSATADPAGEAQNGVLRLDFDGRLMVQFRGPVVTSDAGLLAYRELDDALCLSEMAGEHLADARTGKNGRHFRVLGSSSPTRHTDLGTSWGSTTSA